MPHRTSTHSVGSGGARVGCIVHHRAVTVPAEVDQAPLAAIAVAVAVAWNLVTWAVYRLDKVRARQQRWRFRERTLLAMAALGASPGALIAVYGHRQRHKAQKLGFMVPLWAIAAAHAGLLATGAWLALR
jgi:uncharacterized membrane protein YsdA (DUF1294 family)